MKILKQAIPRNVNDNRCLTASVAEIIAKVRELGDQAVFEYNKRFDRNYREIFRLSKDEVKKAYESVSKEDIARMRTAAANIEAFAIAQKKSLAEIEDFSPCAGVYLGHRIIPVSSCCCYIPGGSYPLYSTALMLVIPAKAAGVKRVAACSPAMKESTQIHPKTVVALDIAGVDEIYAVGGAHAVAAFSYGTEQIEPVNLIVGPGNQYVTEAKRQCYGQVGIDFLAGPSEVLVLADGTANPQIIAADLLAQAEHDLLAKGILITTDINLAEQTISAVEEQLMTLPTADIAAKAWADYGEVILAGDIKEAVSITNSYAPEHLEVILKDDSEVLPALNNYGSLFIGQASAEVFGDYASGTNHTLPTMKAARYTGGVWSGTYLKVCTHQRLNKLGVDGLGELTSEMARGEGLIAHARAAEIRGKLL